jgi:hypothetical protein
MPARRCRGRRASAATPALLRLEFATSGRPAARIRQCRPQAFGNLLRSARLAPSSLLGIPDFLQLRRQLQGVEWLLQ